jgi:prevent-host-death family protein
MADRIRYSALPGVDNVSSVENVRSLENLRSVHTLQGMVQEIPVTQARDELADLVNRVAYGHERITLTRHGKVVAGLVPPGDLAWLEQRSQERVTLTSTGETITMPQPSAAPGVQPIAAKHTETPSSPPEKQPRRR